MRNENELASMNKLNKAIYYIREYGIGFFLRKIAKKLGIRITEKNVYQSWLRAKEPSRRDLKRQRKMSFPKMLQVCIVIDGIRASRHLIDSTLRTVKRQTYLECRSIVIATEQSVSDLVQSCPEELLVFVKAGIMLRPQMVYELMKSWNQEAGYDCAYMDEDCKVKGKYCKPYFKPDKDEELILNFQYLGDVIAVSHEQLAKLSTADLWNNEWYELVLRIFEEKGKIVHIPQVLFAKTQDIQENVFFRDKIGNAGKYIEESLQRRGVDARMQESEVPGFYHVKYVQNKKPLISIIIPNKDHIAELEICIHGILNKNIYNNYEIIIAENNSQEENTFHYYKKLQQEHDNIKVVYWEKEFNYSAINNFAVESAQGELLLFLNNDTEIINPDCLEELVQCCYRENVGAAGAMLYYPDDTIQHGGVVIGIGGFAAHSLWSLTDRDERYYPYSVTMRECSACTGACLMVARDVFEQAGGFDEELAVALNDIDLCLKVRKLNKKIIFNPYAKMYHYESKSRGYEDSQEKIERFNREIRYFQKKWKPELEAGDPYYNRNQTLHYADYSLDW